jgi:hypothetical protein
MSIEVNATNQDVPPGSLSCFLQLIVTRGLFVETYSELPLLCLQNKTNKGTTPAEARIYYWHPSG